MRILQLVIKNRTNYADKQSNVSDLREIAPQLARDVGEAEGALDHARAATRLLVAGGCDTAAVVLVPEGVGDPLVRGGAGDVATISGIAVPLAERLASSGRALRIAESGSRIGKSHVRYAALRAGDHDGAAICIIVSGRHLPTHDLETAAVSLSDMSLETPHLGLRRPGADLARDLAAETGADVVSVALFARAGMQVDAHVRSGDLLRRSRLPISSMWGEVARHGAAYSLGELGMHQGTEHLGALGLQTAVLVALENDAGVPVGALGVASRDVLATDLPARLLERTRPLAREVMQAHSSTQVPRRGAGQQVELRLLAARVGCKRFAVYMNQGDGLAMLGCYAGDGASLSAPPDVFEEELVRTAADRGVSIVTEGAAVVLLANGVMLYASDTRRDPMERLQLALRDVVDDPYGEERAA